MKLNRYFLAAPFALLVLVLALSSCEQRDAAEETPSFLNRALNSDPDSLDPQRARSTQSADVIRDLGEGLLGYAADGELVAASAERWTVSEDGLLYTFTLRDGLRWSNGEPVTAEHFVFALRRLVNPETAAFYAEQISVVVNAAAITAGDMPVESLGAEALDARTLQLRVEQPTPVFLYLLTHPSTFPVNPEVLQQHGDDFTDPENYVSNGAYRLESREIGSVITLTRNKYYWNAANVAIERVRHHVVADEMSEINRYRAGELDMTSTVPTAYFEQAKIDFPDELRVAPTLAVYYYGFNMTQPPFADNPALRQALSMAVDRDQLVNKVTARGELPAYSWVPPGVDNYTPPEFAYSNLTQEERNEMAQSLYRQAGYSESNPLKVELRYNTSDVHRRIATAVTAMWSDVLGVETQLIGEEFRVLLQNIREGEITQVFRSSWTGDYTDAVTFLGIMAPGATWNLTGYDSEEYGELIAQAAAQTDMQARRLYLEEAERVLLRDHSVVPLYFYVSKQLVSPRVLGREDNPLNYHYSQYLSLVDTEE
ncbi:MAG: peptide ABC transporter substrate-binding protein [Pseudomonadota bacterium]